MKYFSYYINVNENGLYTSLTVYALQSKAAISRKRTYYNEASRRRAIILIHGIIAIAIMCILEVENSLILQTCCHVNSLEDFLMHKNDNSECN